MVNLMYQNNTAINFLRGLDWIIGTEYRDRVKAKGDEAHAEGTDDSE